MVTGHVASTGELINTAQAYDHPKFNRDIDLKSGNFFFLFNPILVLIVN